MKDLFPKNQDASSLKVGSVVVSSFHIMRRGNQGVITSIEPNELYSSGKSASATFVGYKLTGVDLAWFFAADDPLRPTSVLRQAAA